MSPRSPLIGAAVALLVVASVAGCVSFPGSDAYEVDFDGVPQRTPDGFRMRGQVEVDSTAAPPRTFAAVTVVLFDADRRVLERVPLGSMSTDAERHPNRRPVEVRSDEAPAYVLISSPDVREHDVRAEAFRWTGTPYESVYVGGRTELFEPTTRGRTGDPTAQSHRSLAVGFEGANG